MKLLKITLFIWVCVSFSSCEVMLLMLEAMASTPSSYGYSPYSSYSSPMGYSSIPSLSQYMAPMMNQAAREAEYISTHYIKPTREGYEEFVRATGSSMTFSQFLSTFGHSAPSSSSSSGSSSSSSSSSSQDRYGMIECHLCDGSGICSTCGGDGLYNGLGITNITCPNCGSKAGSPVGKCSKCKGSGKAYGLKDLDGKL